MGCASSVQTFDSAQTVCQPVDATGNVAQQDSVVLVQSQHNRSDAYFKANPEREGESLFCDDDGCETVDTANTETVEDATSAHRYVDFIARERRSIAHSASEPSAFASAISHKYRVARAYVKYGITGDTDQFQDEVDRAVPVFSSRAKMRVWEWLKNVVQAPPRGTRVETVKLFKRVKRGSVVSLGGSFQPDVRRSLSVSIPRAGGVPAYSNAQTSTVVNPVITPDDVLDELLMGSGNQGARAGISGASPSDSKLASEPSAPRTVQDEAAEEAPFALPENFGLDTLAVGTVIGVDGEHEYDLVVVQAETEVVVDEEADFGNVPNAINEGLLSPHTYQNATTSSSHRDSSSVNSKERFDYMSISQGSLLNDAELDTGNLITSREVDPREESGRGRKRGTVDGDCDEPLESDPICQRIHNYNTHNGATDVYKEQKQN